MQQNIFFFWGATPGFTGDGSAGLLRVQPQEAHEWEQASGGVAGRCSSPSPEEVGAPASVGTKRSHTRRQTTAPGLADKEGGGDMAVDDSPGTASMGRWKKRGITGKSSPEAGSTREEGRGRGRAAAAMLETRRGNGGM